MIGSPKIFGLLVMVLRVGFASTPSLNTRTCFSLGEYREPRFDTGYFIPGEAKDNKSSSILAISLRKSQFFEVLGTQK